MRQRAMIAIALASNPKLLLADEPTTALDVTIQDQILKLILRLRDELQMSVVLVTHDLGVIAQTCDRLAVMYAGRVAETGTVAALFRAPRHAYTLGLLNSVPRAGLVRQPLASIPGQPPLLSQLPSGCAFAPRCRFVTDACTVAKPALVEIAPGHAAACIHHDQVAAAGT
jgi:peptide/nickel transport system ATP-binding protein/oligopeptide transport system ATP-binding protein